MAGIFTQFNILAAQGLTILQKLLKELSLLLFFKAFSDPMEIQKHHIDMPFVGG